MEIKLGTQYYFNNRPVIPVQKVKDAGFYLCVIEVPIEDYISEHLDPQYFCAECMGGSGYGTHRCESAGDVLSALEEFVLDKDVIFVPTEMLKEHYFEWQKNEELTSAINQKESQVIELDIKLIETDKQIKELLLEQEKQKAELEKLLATKTELLAKNHELSEENKAISTKSEKADIQVTEGISIKLKELQSLYADSFRLRALESGGVDNWDWYSESLGGRDFEEEALNYILKLKSN